jgi:hypothetical protein
LDRKDVLLLGCVDDDGLEFDTPVPAFDDEGIHNDVVLLGCFDDDGLEEVDTPVPAFDDEGIHNDVLRLTSGCFDDDRTCSDWINSINSFCSWTVVKIRSDWDFRGTSFSLLFNRRWWRDDPDIDDSLFLDLPSRLEERAFRSLLEVRLDLDGSDFPRPLELWLVDVDVGGADTIVLNDAASPFFIFLTDVVAEVRVVTA